MISVESKQYPIGTRVWMRVTGKSGIVTATFKQWNTHNLIWAMVLWDDGYEDKYRIKYLTKNPKNVNQNKLPEGFKWSVMKGDEPGEL